MLKQSISRVLTAIFSLIIACTDNERKEQYTLTPDNSSDIIEIIREHSSPSLPFHLLLAIAVKESNLQPNAINPKTGCSGLFQINPCNFEYLNLADPFDPSENTRAACALLYQYNKMFKRDVPLMLASFNAGPSVVKRYNGIPRYAETQQYVADVIALSENFRLKIEAGEF